MGCTAGGDIHHTWQAAARASHLDGLTCASHGDARIATLPLPTLTTIPTTPCPLSSRSLPRLPSPTTGETLASGQRGTPFRLQVRKDSGATTTLTYANFSEAYVAKPSERGSWREAPEAQQPRRLVDYSQLELTQDDGKRAELGAKLGKIAVLLEQRLGGPQDVEGCVADGVVYIVQSRPQP